MAELQNPNVMPSLINFLSSLLQKVAESNDVNCGVQAQKISVFHGLSRPTISIRNYLDRIYKYANRSNATPLVSLLHMFISIGSLKDNRPSLPINSFNVHRLLITSVMVAAKFLDDMYYNNAYYAKVRGISTMEMNLLEVEFLFGLGFKLHVTPNDFQAYYSYLKREMMLHPPPSVAESSLSLGRSLKLQLCFNEEDSSHKKQQLAV